MKWDLVLHSDYPPETCAERLAEQIDVDKRALFSLSGYKGSKSVVGRIESNEFRLHWRRYWHNSFGPILFGRVSAQGKGSLIEGYWEMSKWSRTSLRVWLVFAILIGTPILFTSLKCAASSVCAQRSALWVGLLVPPGMVLGGWLLPRLGAALSFHERKHIVSLVEQTLAAGPTSPPERERTWAPSLDNYSFWL